MEAITFSPAQVHVFNLVSHIKSALGLELLRDQLTKFYAKQVDDEMDRLWESGEWDEKKLNELRGSHFRMGLITADPDDNKFVDCAFAAGADYLVSEDRHFDVLRNTAFPKINLVTLDEFMKTRLVSE